MSEGSRMIEVVTDLARRAGRVVMEHYRPIGRRRIIERKQAQHRNLVTAADRASEELILAGLREAFPEHGIVAEESGEEAADREYVWHVDPLDGTVNFAHSLPFFGVSIGLCRLGEPILGVVHAPASGETFSGEVGRGAELDGTPIEVSDTRELSESLLATGFAYVRNEHPDHNVDNFSTLILAARGIRRMGAAALDLCYTAAGRYDGFWELHLSSWDVVAGVAIVRAAGGTVTDLRGGTDFVTGGHIVATNTRIHETLRTTLHPLRAL